MSFFREASDFTIEGGRDNQSLPNIPGIMAGVAHITHGISSGLPPGSHFQGTIQAMDQNTSSYLEAELAQKHATLQAMKERKARRAEAAKIGGMQYPGVGFSGCYSTENGGTQAKMPSQIPLEFHPGIGPQQGMNPTMLPSVVPVDVSLQDAPFNPRGTNIPPQGFPPYHPWEPNSNAMNTSYYHDPRLVQGASGYYIPPTHPPSHIYHQQHSNPEVADPMELDEEAEMDEQSQSSPPSANYSNDPYKSTRTSLF